MSTDAKQAEAVPAAGAAAEDTAAAAGAGGGAGAGSTGGEQTSAWRMETPAEFMRSPEDVRHALAEFSVYLSDRTRHHLGYPYNLKFDTAALAPFLQYSINNLGDPFVPSNYGVHSRKFELEVLNFFADLWRIPRDDYWGYTTTCGTEGNLLGVLYGREKLPEATLFCSRDTHYSVPKAAMMFRIPLCLVDSQESGEIDYEDLAKKLAEHPGQAIVTFNAGTTVKGAVDCVDRVIEVVRASGRGRDEFYIHCDGALAGLIVPFVEHCDVAYEVSFEKEIDSISVSGHKMLGCPMPCGVVLTRKEHMERFRKDVEYLNSRDTTIMVRQSPAGGRPSPLVRRYHCLLLTACGHCVMYYRARATARRPSRCGTRCNRRASRACAATWRCASTTPSTCAGCSPLPVSRRT